MFFENDNLKNIIKNYFSHELQEMKKNKLRVAGLAVCFLCATVFYFDNGEENIEVDDSEKISEEKKIVEVKQTAPQNSDEKIKIVLGANSSRFSIRDPFENLHAPQKTPDKKFFPTSVNPPDKKIFPQNSPAENPKPKEIFILTGTAINEKNKLALVKKLNSNENFIFSVGDTLDGKKISDITDEFILFDNGEKLGIGE